MVGGAAGSACTTGGATGFGAGRATGGALGAGFDSTAAFGFASAFCSLAFTGDGRALRPRRCALPITALRETPPSSSAIWLAVEPPSHILVRVAMRSSVQLIRIQTSFKRVEPRYLLPAQDKADSRLAWPIKPQLPHRTSPERRPNSSTP